MPAFQVAKPFDSTSAMGTLTAAAAAAAAAVAFHVTPRKRILRQPHPSSTGHSTIVTGRTTALPAASGVEAAALGFFSGIRIPAALIAGSSLSALFSLVDKTKTKSKSTTTTHSNDSANDEMAGGRWQINLLVLYHIFSLISLLLSLNVVITATAAGTTLLLDEHDSVAVSAFEFLKREMYYELLTTRWSFFTSLLAFMGAVTTRTLIEFDLIQNPQRHKMAGVFLLSVGSLVTHLISFINGSLYSSPNLVVMTFEVIKVRRR